MNELGASIESVEFWNRKRWTIRAPGIDFQSARLSLIRQICQILKIDSIHENHGMQIRAETMEELKD